MSRAPDHAAREQRAAAFESNRPHLFSLAYRMLGSAADAEDVVQEAYLRWQAEERGPVASPRAWLTTVVTRLCLDALGAARRKRETYAGPWLPEPVDTRTLEPPDVSSISVAFLLVLESLSPLERATFILREVFDYDFDEVGRVLERDEEAVKKLAQRARAHVAERRPRFAASKEAHGRILHAFLGAVAEGNVQRIESLLAADVRAAADGGGRVSAARKVMVGRGPVARYVMGLARKGFGGEVELGTVNGWPSVVFVDGGRTSGVLEIETDGEQIYAVYLVLNPEKLTRARSPSGA